MYTREKPSREEFHKSRKNINNIPSFSSTLLDEIYRSIDGNAEKKPSKRNGETASFGRACLVEKWIEKETIAKRKPTLLQDFENDLMFFSSTSSSSDSSGALSSSDTEFFGSTTKPKAASCFSSARLKPVRTGNHQKEQNRRSFPSDDDYKKEEKSKMEDDVMMKSKSRAMKIYANLKKVKQPISPGVRLTSFINSLFSNANGKKSKNVETGKVLQDPSTCSSASSFSRSCLSKYSPNSREKMRNGAQRTVRFHPVSVIVDEDSRACGQKCTYDQEFEKLLLRPSTETKQRNRVVGGLKGYNGKRIDAYEDEDCMSDSSSDLFELDHLSLFGDDRFCQELPVYETTHFDTNRAIASGLIR
ncbi:hypothetical protein ACS0TY_021176 [Phlomoides rotata]